MQSIKDIYEKSFQDAMATIPDKVFKFSQLDNDGKEKHHRIEPDDYKKALRNKFGDFGKFSKNFSDHLLGQQNLIAAFASTPISFSDAWNMKAKELTYQVAFYNKGKADGRRRLTVEKKPQRTIFFLL